MKLFVFQNMHYVFWHSKLQRIVTTVYYIFKINFLHNWVHCGVPGRVTSDERSSTLSIQPPQERRAGAAGVTSGFTSLHTTSLVSVTIVM